MMTSIVVLMLKASMAKLLRVQRKVGVRLVMSDGLLLIVAKMVL